MLICGDVHQKIDKYIDMVKDSDYSLQLGDMGFDYTQLSVLDHEKHKMILGNHDNYNNIPPHALGDFGVWKNIFYIRGAYSIDKIYRTEGVDWFPEEELNYAQQLECIDFYTTVKPDIVVSHDCPEFLLRSMFGYSKLYKNSTNKFLQHLYYLHEPKIWYFGHHHVDLDFKCNNTLFQCLGELVTTELHKDDYGAYIV